MVCCHLAGDDVQLILSRDLSQKIADARRHWPRQHPLAVLGTPHQVDLEVVLCGLPSRYRRIVRLHLPFPSPEGEGLCPRNGTIKEIASGFGGDLGPAEGPGWL